VRRRSSWLQGSASTPRTTPPPAARYVFYVSLSSVHALFPVVPTSAKSPAAVEKALPSEAEGRVRLCGSRCFFLLSDTVRTQYGQALGGANAAMYGSLYNEVGVVPQGAQGMVVNHGGLVSNYGGNVQNLQVRPLQMLKAAADA